MRPVTPVAMPGLSHASGRRCRQGGPRYSGPDPAREGRAVMASAQPADPEAGG